MTPFAYLLSDAVRRLAKRARTNPLLVAWALARYQRQHHLHEGTLAAQLGLTPAQLASLALCHRPDPTLPHFILDVRAIALASGCDAALLAEVLLEAESDPRQRR